MSITINYTAASSSIGGGFQDYLSYYAGTFSLPTHYSTGGFSSVDSSNNWVGATNYGSTYSDLQYASETVASGQASAFIAEAPTNQQLGYTLFQSPQHTLFGTIDHVDFGETLSSSSGLWSLGTTYFNVTNLASHINNGINGTPAVIAGNNTSTSGNDTHNLVWNLMQGQTNILKGYLDTYGTNQIGTASDDFFDPFNSVDTFVVNGGDDVISTGFTVGSSGGDVVDLNGAGYSIAYGSDAVITYAGGTVTLIGVTSGLVGANII